MCVVAPGRAPDDSSFTTPGECIETIHSMNQTVLGTNMPTIPREHLRGIVVLDVLGMLAIHVPEARMIAAMPRQRRVSRAG